MSILSLFCEIDDFFLALVKHQAQYPLQETEGPSETRGRRRSLHRSEIMTGLINFHQSNYRTFKDYYQRHVCVYLRWAFPNRRIPSHRVFAKEADRGKTSMGGFYGFKLHLLINSTGDLLGVRLTPGNRDDRAPVAELMRQTSSL